MNKIKEKKLNSIKSQLNEINEFVKVNVNQEVLKKIDNNISFCHFFTNLLSMIFEEYY